MSEETKPPIEPAKPPAEKAKKLKVRILQDCQYGAINQVISCAEAEAKSIEEQGLGDSNEAAVKYAEKLAKAAAKPDDVNE
jgi:hypothetical protein